MRVPVEFNIAHAIFQDCYVFVVLAREFLAKKMAGEREMLE
jgi:hypothetical protein